MSESNGVVQETKKGAGILRVERACNELRDALVAVLTGRATVEMVRLPEGRMKAAPKILDDVPVARTRRPPQDTDGPVYATDGTLLPIGARKILVVLAQARGQATRSMVTVLTDYKERSITTYLNLLRQNEYVERGTLTATRAGVLALGSSFRLLPEGDALREHWERELGGGERKLLDVLVATYPAAVSHGQLMEATDLAERSVTTYVQKLKARQVLVKIGRHFRANDALFTHPQREPGA